jgi:hypothetical protein
MKWNDGKEKKRKKNKFFKIKHKICSSKELQVGLKLLKNIKTIP